MISYCHINAEIVDHVVAFLNERNVLLWIDKNPPGGHGMQVHTNAAMADAIRNASVIIPFLSEEYCRSRVCTNEINFAQDQSKQLLPVRLDDSDEVRNGPNAFIIAGHFC